MQFEGLQGLLKKKRQSQDAEATTPPTTSTAASSSTAPKNAGDTTDPYAAALQRAQQQQQQQQQQRARHQLDDTRSMLEGRKRSREQLDVEDGNYTEGDGERHSNDTTVTLLTSATATKTDAETSFVPEKTLKSAEDIRAERRRGVAVLQRCRTQLEEYWARVRKDTTSTATDAPLSDSLLSSSSPPLPTSLGDYLITYFVSETRVSATTGEPEIALVNREFALLSALHTELMADDAMEAEKLNATSVNKPCVTSGVMSPELRNLGETVRVLWYLIALRWQYSLDPCQVTASKGAVTKAALVVSSPQALPPDQQGFSPFVYLAFQGALPADVRLTLGRAVGQEMDQWRALTRTRQFALELLAYLYSDYITLQTMTTLSTTYSGTAAAQACIVPVSLRDNLHVMLVQHLQRERSYLAVRQDYVDVTMGTANWKLGLFSGGEVHMRRSMERVERNRIHHLLNNEHATHLLQSVREVTTFVEQLKSPSIESFFYVHR